jgi:hypothetical protein
MTAATELSFQQSTLDQMTEIVPGDDDSLDIWVVLLDRLQNTQSTIDCRVEQFFGVVGIHVEWRSGMSYRVNTLDCFVE